MAAYLVSSDSRRIDDEGFDGFGEILEVRGGEVEVEGGLIGPFFDKDDGGGGVGFGIEVVGVAPGFGAGGGEHSVGDFKEGGQRFGFDFGAGDKNEHLGRV